LGLFVAGATGWVLVWFDSDGEPWKRRRG
jgi:hypothetical protein